MKKHLKRMIAEHKDLCDKINNLNNFLYSGINVHTDIENNKTQEDIIRNMIEFGNKCIKLKAMKIYREALECNLHNEGVYVENGVYLERYIPNDNEE